MPRITYIKTPKKAVKPPKTVSSLFRRYMDAGGLTSDQLGEKIGHPGASIRVKLSKENFSLQEIREWCSTLDITDPAELGKAILYK